MIHHVTGFTVHSFSPGVAMWEGVKVTMMFAVFIGAMLLLYVAYVIGKPFAWMYDRERGLAKWEERFSFD